MVVVKYISSLVSHLLPLGVEVKLDPSKLHEHSMQRLRYINILRHPGPATWVCNICSPTGSVLSLMLCCPHLAILNNRRPQCSFFPSPTNYVASSVDKKTVVGKTQKNTLMCLIRFQGTENILWKILVEASWVLTHLSPDCWGQRAVFKEVGVLCI